MAFTVAHMAAALPFYNLKRWLQFDALMIGTMMPDFPYYIGSQGSFADLSHQWLGVFIYCLPWGLIVFALWYWLLKPAAIGLIQPFLGMQRLGKDDLLYINASNRYDKKGRIYSYADSYWLRSLALPVMFGLIFGTATHLLWDGITHADGFIARHIDWLQYPVYIYPFKGTSIARLLQYLSSIVGLGTLIWFAKSHLQTWRHNTYDLDEQTVLPNTIEPLLTKKSSLLAISLIILFCLIWNFQTFLQWYPLLRISPYTFAAILSVSFLQDIVILFIGYAVIYHFLYLVKYGFLSHNKTIK